MRHALIEKATGVVINVIELEPGSQWSAPPGTLTVPSATASPGDRWDGASFQRQDAAVPTAPGPGALTAEARLDALAALIAEASTPDELFRQLKTALVRPDADAAAGGASP